MVVCNIFQNKNGRSTFIVEECIQNFGLESAYKFAEIFKCSVLVSLETLEIDQWESTN